MNVTGTRLRLMKVSVMRKRLLWKTSLWYPRSPTGYLNTVIPIQIFAQSRSPDGYFRHPASRAYFQSRNSPPYCFEIPNPGLQIRQIQHPETPLGTLILIIISPFRWHKVPDWFFKTSWRARYTVKVNWTEIDKKRDSRRRDSSWSAVWHSWRNWREI